MNRVTSPARLSSCVSAIACAAPETSANALPSSNLSSVPPRAATTSSKPTPAFEASTSILTNVITSPPQELRLFWKVSAGTPNLARLPFIVSRFKPSPANFFVSESVEYHDPSIAKLNSFQRCELVAKSALTDFKSVLLKILLSACVRCSCVIFERALFRSANTSFRGRILPAASKTCSPSFFIAFVDNSVGADNERIMLRNAVPPSDPLTPLSARMPRAVASSVVPPAKFLAVPPIVRNAAPNCATLVFDFDDAAAILSTIWVVSAKLKPRALCASVIMSEAAASSILPAAARFNTFGNICIDVFAS